MFILSSGESHTAISCLTFFGESTLNVGLTEWTYLGSQATLSTQDLVPTRHEGDVRHLAHTLGTRELHVKHGGAQPDPCPTPSGGGGCRTLDGTLAGRVYNRQQWGFYYFQCWFFHAYQFNHQNICFTKVFLKHIDT